MLLQWKIKENKEIEHFFFSFYEISLDNVHMETFSDIKNHKQVISNFISKIKIQTLQSVCGSFEKRLRNFIRTKGSHFENILT